MRLIEQVAPTHVFTIELTAEEASELLADLEVVEVEMGLEPTSRSLFSFIKERLD